MGTEREVRIYGQAFKVKGDDPHKIDRVAGHVDSMMNELLGGPGQGLSARGAVLVALNITDQWFDEKDEVKKAIHDLNERVDELLGLLPES